MQHNCSLFRLLSIILILCFQSAIGYSQSRQQLIDSLEQAYGQAQDPLQRANLARDLADKIFSSDPEKGKTLLLEAIQLFEQLAEIKQVAYAKNLLSQIYLMENKWDTIIQLNMEGLALIEGKGMNETEAMLYTVLGVVAEEQGQYETAIGHFEKILSLSESLQTKMVINNNLGNLYNDLNYYDKALLHLLKAKDAAAEMGSIRGESAIATNIGNSYLNMEKYEEALISFRNAVSLKEQNGDEHGKIYGLTGLGSTYSDLDSLDIGTAFFQEALEIAKSFDNIRNQFNLLERIGENHLAQGNIKAARDTFQACLQLIERTGNEGKTQKLASVNVELSRIYYDENNYSVAISHAQKGIEAAKSYFSEVSASQVEGTYVLAQCYQSLGQHQKAFEILDKYIVLNDSLKKIQNLKETQTLELKYNVSQKEKEMTLLETQKDAEIEAQKANNRFFTVLALIALLVAGLLIYFLRQQTRQKRQVQQQNQTIAKQAEELQALDKLKSRLFANVSHELRTPLTLILGPLRSALKDAGLDKRTQTFLHLAQQNGQKLLQLINEILDLSKMDAGKLELIEKPVLMLPFMQRLLAQFESHAEGRKVELSLSFQADDQFQAVLDAHKFEIVLNNLVSNALKFTPSGGKVVVAMQNHKDQLILTVSDTGPGIPAEDLGLIFDRFYQSNQSENNAGGTGIGLALCKEYAKLFGGSLEVESQIGKGATFTFSFPFKEASGTLEVENTPGSDETPILPLVPDAGTTTGSHLLLVEDNHSLRTYIRTVLGNEYRITTAENGQAALDILSQNGQSFDLIISDVMMPVMDGFQFLERLKSDQKWRSVPVIMLTARAEMQDKLKALRIGVDDYMTKPFDEEELLARVGNLLQNASQRHLPHEEIVAAGLDSSELAEEGEGAPDFSSEDMAWLERIESLTKASIGNLQFGVDDMAYEIGASRSKLHRKLKLLTGLTPNHYIVEVRLQQAKYLLETHQLSSVKATSLEVGFKDIKYFSKKFRQRFGKLPSEYLAA